MSSIDTQPKTIEDYKDVVKILKLKIIKQNRKIIQLQKKVKQYEQEINQVTITNINDHQNADKKKQTSPSPEFDTSNLKGKAAVMYLFLQGSKKLGITPQSIFRIADFNCKGIVESDYFRSVLSKINLSLTPKQISCLIFTFDENCSGFIHREQYCQTLYAYQIGMEESNLPYNQECLLKLASYLHSDKINLNKFYQDMEGIAKSVKGKSKPIVDANIFQKQVKKMYDKKILEREIIGSFNQMDLQSQGYLERTNFLYCITSFINRVLLHEDIPTQKTAITGFHQNTSSPNKNLQQSNSKHNQQINIQIQEKNTHVLQTLLSIHKIKLNQIYQQIIRLSFQQRITLRKFKFAILILKKDIPQNLLTSLFKQIDNRQKGSIYINELISFWLNNSSSTTDFDIVYKLIAKYFYYNDLSAQRLMFTNGLDSDSDITKVKFIQIMSKQFESDGKDEWDGLWSTLDKGNRGVVSTEAIIKIMSKYEHI